jgi:hypothetical protein
MAWHWSQPIVVGADVCTGWSGSIESTAELPRQHRLTMVCDVTVGVAAQTRDPGFRT